jgi:hypothetical protein
MATLRNEGRSAGSKAGGRQDWRPHNTRRLKPTLQAEACATKIGGAK